MTSKAYIKYIFCAVVLFLQMTALSFAQTTTIIPITSEPAPVAAEQKEKTTESEIRAKQIDERVVDRAHKMKGHSQSLVEYVRKNISPELADFSEKTFWGISVMSIIFGVAIFLVLWLFQHFVLSFVFNLFLRTKSDLKPAECKLVVARLQHPLRWIFVLIGINIIVYLLIENQTALFFLGRISRIFFLSFIFWALIIISDFAYKFVEEKLSIKYVSTRNLLDLARRITKYCLMTVCVVAVLDSQGVNINAIMASLGIGGAALAFASKDTIANFFGSISLIADRPFVVGDWVTVGNIEGIVENVGFRSTRIRTFQKAVVTIPNSMLANEPVENWTRRNKRRVKMSVGLTYSTTAEQMEEIVSDIRKILLSTPKVDDNDVRVHFLAFGDSSLNIDIMYYIYEMDTIPYNNVIQQVNLSIMRAVAARKLSFAFPSRSLYIETMPPMAQK